jgi:hypothetical protein
MNVAPVANQREHQQHKHNQQQASGFRRVDGVAAMLAFVLVLGSAIRHADIVAPLIKIADTDKDKDKDKD